MVCLETVAVALVNIEEIGSVTKRMSFDYLKNVVKGTILFRLRSTS